MAIKISSLGKNRDYSVEEIKSKSWGMSVYSGPEGITAWKNNCIVFALGKGYIAPTMPELYELTLNLEQLNNLSVLKVMYALYELTLENFDLFVSCEEIMKHTHLTINEVEEALKKLPLTVNEKTESLFTDWMDPFAIFRLCSRSYITYTNNKMKYEILQNIENTNCNLNRNDKSGRHSLDQSYRAFHTCL